MQVDLRENSSGRRVSSDRRQNNSNTSEAYVALHGERRSDFDRRLKADRRK